MLNRLRVAVAEATAAMLKNPKFLAFRQRAQRVGPRRGGLAAFAIMADVVGLVPWAVWPLWQLRLLRRAVAMSRKIIQNNDIRQMVNSGAIVALSFLRMATSASTIWADFAVKRMSMEIVLAEGARCRKPHSLPTAR